VLGARGQKYFWRPSGLHGQNNLFVTNENPFVLDQKLILKVAELVTHFTQKSELIKQKVVGPKKNLLATNKRDLLNLNKITYTQGQVQTN